MLVMSDTLKMCCVPSVFQTTHVRPVGETLKNSGWGTEMARPSVSRSRKGRKGSTPLAALKSPGRNIATRWYTAIGPFREGNAN